MKEFERDFFDSKKNQIQRDGNVFCTSILYNKLLPVDCKIHKLCTECKERSKGIYDGGVDDNQD